MTNTGVASANILDFKHIGWRYYNQIRKKAMEQEFSWSGLALSLSIAFFIVIFAASCFRICYLSIEQPGSGQKIIKEKFYQLEVFDNSSREQYLQPASMDLNKMESVCSIYLA